MYVNIKNNLREVSNKWIFVRTYFIFKQTTAPKLISKYIAYKNIIKEKIYINYLQVISRMKLSKKPGYLSHNGDWQQASWQKLNFVYCE
jgi:hypothetical protein